MAKHLGSRETRPQSTTSLGDIVERLVADGVRERLSAGDLVDGCGDRAFGILVFLFAMPNFMPIALPGTSAVLGVPLFLLTCQMLLGARRPWLPEAIRRRSVKQADAASFVRRVLPWLRRMEKVVRPRLLVLTGSVAERLIGAVGLILAATIALPIPFGNALPAFTLAVLALGLAERDGVVVAVGALLSVLSLTVTSAVLAGLFFAGLWIIRAA